ncbi:MAG TPA: hypothetical protein VM537_11875 [Anaerolineae bacterium]|nr:hypothetical protein [Anaerolineae bacterium]
MGRHRDERTTSDRADLYEVVMPLLQAMYHEFKDFSKKKPDGAVGKNTILVTNRLLRKCRTVLESEPSLEFLDLLNEDDVPHNSDVILMLSQYVAAMEQFKGSYYGYDDFLEGHTWSIRD